MNIYIITNKLNKKRYVGLTTRTIKSRFSSHKYTAKNNKGFYLHNAIRKYGIENFTIDLLDTAISIEEMKQKEIFYIKKYDTFRNGYNLTIGGDFSSNKGFVVAVDTHHNICRIPVSEFLKRNDLTHINKNKITIFKDNDKIRVSPSEYKNKYFKEGWRSKNYGFTIIKKLDGSVERIKSNDFDKSIHKGVASGTQLYFNSKNKKFEALLPENIDLNIHFNKYKLKYIVYDDHCNIKLISLSRDIPEEFGGKQFRYLVNRNKLFTELKITEDVLKKLKIKNREIKFLGYKLVKVKYK